MRHLIINLEAPLMSFGGETIDNLGVIRWFPSASMLTGLLANSLGLRRVDRDSHQRLQDRLVFASRIDREPAGGARMTDFQTVAISNTDRAWTTHGVREGRAGGTYQNSLRYRDYFPDMCVTVALRLDPADESPELHTISDALREPARPLFIGRKPCLPSAPLLRSTIEAETVLSALLSAPLDTVEDAPGSVRMMWPEGEGFHSVAADRTYMLTDQRNWVSGLHGGGRAVCEGTLPRDEFPRSYVSNRKDE